MARLFFFRRRVDSLLKLCLATSVTAIDILHVERTEALIKKPLKVVPHKKIKVKLDMKKQ
jgi:hypothetical protein